MVREQNVQTKLIRLGQILKIFMEQEKVARIPPGRTERPWPGFPACLRINIFATAFGHLSTIKQW